MVDHSSAQVAKKLGITRAALSNYIKLNKVPAPRAIHVGKMKLQAWNDEEVEQLRKLLPKIANGRKTRYQKKKSAVSKKQSVKTKKKKPAK
jgi:predicted transcriptional regulator